MVLRAFLTETYSGVLVLELLNAANLRPADRNGLSDPYAVITLGGSSFRSRTVAGSLDPKWDDEQYCMYIKCVGCHTTCRDERRGRRGSCMRMGAASVRQDEPSQSSAASSGRVAAACAPLGS
jgi:hypothetical protein